MVKSTAWRLPLLFEIPPIESNLGKVLPRVVLASQSPARKALLEERGCIVTPIPTDCDESHDGKDPDQVVESLAIRKLESYLALHGESPIPVIAADTLIHFNGSLIGKASTRDEARQQLAGFSGQTHVVHSGYAIFFPDQGKGTSMIVHGCDHAKVVFNELTITFIEDYLDSGEWKGAAGSYRIQNLGKQLIDHIDGDYCTVVGLPIDRISGIVGALVSDY